MSFGMFAIAALEERVTRLEQSSPLPELRSVEVLRPQPGDVVVVTPDQHLDREQSKRWMATLGRVFDRGGVRVVLLQPSKVAVVREGDEVRR